MKKLTLFVFVILIISCSTNKRPNIESTNDLKISFSDINELSMMPRAAYGFGYTSDNNNIYTINGAYFKRPNFITEISRYNIDLDNWELLRTDLRPKRYLSTEYLNGKIYIFNGQLPNKYMNQAVEIYDIAKGNLTYGSKNPNPVMHSGSAVWDNKIYIFGGTVNDEIYSNQLYSYDPDKNEWNRLANMPNKIQLRGQIVDGILYTFGGYNGHISKSIDAYNIDNDSWTHIGEMPIGISANAITKHGKNIWLLGSYDNLKSVAVFNTETKEFTQIQSNMWKRRHAGAEVINDKLYVLGGNEDKFGPATASIQVTNLAEFDKVPVENMVEAAEVQLTN